MTLKILFQPTQKLKKKTTLPLLAPTLLLEEFFEVKHSSKFTDKLTKVTTCTFLFFKLCYNESKEEEHEDTSLGCRKPLRRPQDWSIHSEEFYLPLSLLMPCYTAKAQCIWIRHHLSLCTTPTKQGSNLCL